MHIKIPNADQIALRNSSDIYQIMQVVLSEESRIDETLKEHFWVIALNQHYKILNIELVGMGTSKNVLADPADVFSLPLHKRASFVVLVHNHPSGNLQPSERDIDMTGRLFHAGQIFRIKVLDHLILGRNAYYSFKDTDLLFSCELDEKYALTLEKRAELEEEMRNRKEEIRLEGEKMGLEKGKEEGEKMGIVKGRQEGLKEGMKMGIKKGETKTLEALVKQGIITQAQADAVLKK